MPIRCESHKRVDGRCAMRLAIALSIGLHLARLSVQSAPVPFPNGSLEQSIQAISK